MIEQANYDMVVVGAGAAGVFGAIQAARTRPDMRILIIEKSNGMLAKVRVSGGGRCNVTNALMPLEDFAAQYPRGKNHMRKLLYRFGSDDTRTWFESRGVPLKSETDLRVFPLSDRSESIINCLIQELEQHQIEVRLRVNVLSVRSSKNIYQLETSQGIICCNTLLIACGGIPKSESYQWMAPLQLKIVPPVPSLFTFNIPDHPAKHLMGLSALCRVRIEDSRIDETGPILITHWGFSGPAVLRCSAWGARILAERNYRFAVRIHWLPEMSQDEIRDYLSKTRQSETKKLAVSRMFETLPGRLWEYLCQRAGIAADMRWANVPNHLLNKLCEVLSADRYIISGKTTFKEEFVTCGGIALEEIDSHTCMAKKHPGLFFAGEILDVDGITGGFNFQHAWSSGYTAGTEAALYRPE
jgi:predicted Rossmann fold flavoprotein